MRTHFCHYFSMTWNTNSMRVCMGLIYDRRMISHHSPGVWLFIDRIYGSLLPLFLAIFPFLVYIGGEVGAITP